MRASLNGLKVGGGGIALEENEGILVARSLRPVSLVKKDMAVLSGSSECVGVDDA